MIIVNGVIEELDESDKNLVIPKDVVGASYGVFDLGFVEGFDSITVEEGNEHFYMQDGCLIWRDQKTLMLATKGAKIPADGSVTKIESGAFMYRQDLKEIEIPSAIKEIHYCAFANTGLEKVVLNEGLEFLEAFAFAYNDNLKELAIPRSVKKIVMYELLMQVEMLAQGGYKSKTYVVHKDSYAHAWAERHGLKYAFAKSQKEHACPVCGKTTFSDYYSCEICPQCGWEDQGGCEQRPDEESDQNYCSLNEYRRRYNERIQADPQYSWANGINVEDCE